MGMPEISRFMGIVIDMYCHDHEPPHFHVTCGDGYAAVAIATGDARSSLPPHVKRSVETWRLQYVEELPHGWRLSRARPSLVQIPLLR